MRLRGIIFSAFIVLGQVGSRYCNLLSGVLYVCDHQADDDLANVEVVNEPNDRQVVFIHSSPSFMYLRIKAKITGCRRMPLYSVKYLTPGDLGLASEDSNYLVEIMADRVRGQHVYHVKRRCAQTSDLLGQHDQLIKINAQVPEFPDHHMRHHQAFNDSITMFTGLGCGQIHSYLLEARGATLCTPYHPHHHAQISNDQSFRVYANDKEVVSTLPPQENPSMKWKSFAPWVLIHYFSLRSWESRAEGTALVFTLAMYLVYLLFKSRKVIRIYAQEQERGDERIV